ncbi:nucleolar protein 12 [Orussus abietinus]|uniref:nucleolar protein 12 n=1 Tax=Orussus abietinus TaxID=222816 RepID=UPI0006259044|nr:nucleolar protein 12 [Orussus abietinus]
MAPRLKAKGPPRKFDVNRIPGQPKKRRKITLVFDEEKRRDFLCGFHKRKVQRQKKAQEELKQQLKEEKKRIKRDAKEHFKSLVSNRDVPEVQELLSRKEYEMEGRTVSILEVNIGDLTQDNKWIGENKVSYESDHESKDEEETDDFEDVAGMELNRDRPSPVKPAVTKPPKKFNTEKDVKRVIKKTATKEIQKSKAFRLKQKLERTKNKKQSLKKQKNIQKKQEGKRGKKAPRRTART